MKKVFDQTVRDIKREVNKKVLKVPGIEQKVLDATSNEPWGPHGVLLADIAQATRNYHEYQMIMSVLWKRINDTGKNWRHVYKALTVLEYLVGHGSERVIDEIRERAYQLSTLSDFRYIDSSGRDQGNNVRKKSQNLVVLVNDKDRIIEVRQKAAANRDKFRNFSAGGMYRPGYGDRYDDERYEGRYGNRDEDRNGYGREREHGYRDDDQYGRYGDPYNRDGDRYGRDYEERYSRDGYRDDDYRGRSRSLDGYGPRSRSADIDRDRGFDDDGPSSSRGSGARADDQSLDGSITRRLERKFSEQNIGAPPNHEEAVGDSRSPAHGERNGDTSAPFAPGASSSSLPPRASSPPAPKAASPQMNVNPSQAIAGTGISSSPGGQVSEVADEFDPRGPVSAVHITATAPTVSVPTTSNNVEVDLLGSLSDSFGPSPLAIMPVTSATTSEADVQKNFSGSTFDTTQTNVMSQPFEDPFGDSPFKAIPSMDNVPAQRQISASPPFLAPTMNQNAEVPHPAASNPDTANDYGGGFSATASSASDAQPPSTSSQFLPQEQSTSQQEIDILADILPPSVPPSFTASHAGFSASTSQPAQPTAGVYGNFNAQGGSLAPVASNLGPQAPLFSSGNFLPQGVSTAPMSSIMTTQTPSGTSAQFNNGNIFPQQGYTAPVMSHVAQHPATGPAPHLSKGSAFQPQGSAVPVAHQTPTVPTVQQSNDIFGNVYSQGTNNPIIAQSALSSSTGALTTVPQPTKDKFETKSTVWTDTLSRGLVNLNISGPKINPLADIGIDFDAINRKEKRMEKPTPSAVTSTITMGKAMGSGSGIGRAGAGGLRPPPNPMIGSGMGMCMGGGPGTGMHMGGYRGISQPMGMGMGTNMGMNMGMGSNMGMGQGGQMQPPGSTLPGGYNPMMGMGGYMPQQPYGGGYR